MEDKLPKYSSDLIDLLDSMVEVPKLPTTKEGFTHLNEGWVRGAALAQGARNLVDSLISWRDQDNETDSHDEDDTAENRFDQVLSSDSFYNSEESPVHMVDISA